MAVFTPQKVPWNSEEGLSSCGRLHASNRRGVHSCFSRISSGVSYVYDNSVCRKSCGSCSGSWTGQASSPGNSREKSTTANEGICCAAVEGRDARACPKQARSLLLKCTHPICYSYKARVRTTTERDCVLLGGVDAWFHVFLIGRGALLC